MHALAGTVWTAAAHIITAVIGSGVLSLAWAMAQLGWVAGPVILLLFAAITYYTCCLLSDCYRVGDPATGKRNYTYTEAVESYLGTCKQHLTKICSSLANSDSRSNRHVCKISVLISLLRVCACVQAGGMSGSAASASMPTCSAPALATPSQLLPVLRRSLHLINNFCADLI
jgi:hypothetical protein